MKKQKHLITAILLLSLVITLLSFISSVPVQANGSTIYRGFANHGDDFLYSRWTSSEFEELKNLGFNLIMPTFWWNDFENSDGSYDTDNIDDANATANLAIAEGLSVIISFRVAYDNTGSGYWTWGNGYPTHDYVNLNQYGGGEYGRTRYAEFLSDIAQKFPQVDGFCLWHFPYHQASCSSGSRTTYYDTTFPALLSAVRTYFSGDIVFVPIHQGTSANGENSNPYKSGGEVETEIDGGEYGDAALIYGIGHMAPYSVIAGSAWDYDYEEMEDAFDGVAYYTATYAVSMMSVEYCPLVWNGYELTTSRLACFESSLEYMTAYNMSWAYWRISQAHAGADDILYPDQAFELNHDLRDLLIEYLPPSIGFQSWQDGFESGDFSKWNGTQTSNGEATVTSTYSYQGVYSANFTADGSLGSYARSMLIIQPVNEVYMKSRVRFEDLPDTDGSRINTLRIAQVDGTWITVASVNRTGGNYYWQIRENVGSASDTQLDNINADQWYNVEIYSNATANGNATLWINNTKMCELTGDFSSVGNIARVYPYIFCGGDNPQSSAKTVYHDSFIVDNERIGSGTPQIFQSVSFLVSGDEEPIEGVKINGTYTTDSSGYYQWANLTYGINTFIVEKPDSYHPAWCLNVYGSFNWNGTHYILSHNVTEDAEDYISIYFFDTSAPFVQNVSQGLKMTNAKKATGNYGETYTYTVDSSGWIIVDGANRKEEPYLQGYDILLDGSKNENIVKTYNPTTDRINLTFSSANTTILCYTKDKATIIPANTLFWISGYNVYVNFTTQQSFTDLYRLNNQWYFSDYSLSVENANMTVTKYFDNEELFFTVTGNSGDMSTSEIYCANLGDPYKVEGVRDWKYDGSTRMVTVHVEHNSPEDVKIYWGATSGGADGGYDSGEDGTDDITPEPKQSFLKKHYLTIVFLIGIFMVIYLFFGRE